MCDIIILYEKELRATPSCRSAPGNVTICFSSPGRPIVKTEDLCIFILDNIMICYSIYSFITRIYPD